MGMRTIRGIAILVLVALVGGCAVTDKPAEPAVVKSPQPVAPPVPAVPPTLFVVGDSTANNNSNGGLGWGTPFITLFDPARVKVVNRARGGRSSRSYQVEGLWDQVLAEAKAGDWIILQMGHNDGGNVTSPNGRPSLAGVGEESQEITKADGKTEVVHTYGWYMRKYIADARAKGLSIIVASSVPHMPTTQISDGQVETRFRQVLWAEEVAKSQNVPFIHVNKIAYSHYSRMTPEEIRDKYFILASGRPDGTHTSPGGAAFHAMCVAEGLKELKDCPLKDYLVQK